MKAGEAVHEMVRARSMMSASVIVAAHADWEEYERYVRGNGP
jgi:hypothetical protein